MNQNDPPPPAFTHECVAVNDPTISVEFRRELADVLNRYNVDNWAETPDHILAGILAEMVAPIRWGRIGTAKWMGQPLLGEKLAASLRDPADAGVVRWAQPLWPGENTEPVEGSPYPPGDSRGFREYDPCRTDLCAANRQHTARCVAARLDTLARQNREQQ